MNRKTYITILGLLALLVLIGTSASAGILDRWTKNEEKQPPAPRYDRYPSAVFQVGQISRAGFDGWKLGEMDLQLAPDCVISNNDGEEVELQEGASVLVAGSRVGDTFLVLRIRQLPANWDFGPENPDQKVVRSETDPTVGEGTGPL